MTFRKTTLAVGSLLALGLGVGTADQAAAGGCGYHKSAKQPPYGYNSMAHRRSAYGYGHSYTPRGPRMMYPMPPQPAMYWGQAAPEATKTATSAASDKKPGDLIEVALGAGSFNMLAAALQAAGLVDTLKSEGPFTVFAPTDEAFNKIPKEQLKALLGDKKALTAVLTYHVVPGKVTAADVVKLSSAETAQGSSVTIDTTDGVKVDNAKVVKTDVMASNGVIHVIDTVIMPN